ncbi:MAG: hypothetical protein PHV59_00270 [Victivallales bacterium]|nr:hypothetical protein [Victivallales bacterium]
MGCRRLVLGAAIAALGLSNGLIAGEKTLVDWGPNAKALQSVWAGKVTFKKIEGKLCGVTDRTAWLVTKQFIPVEAGKKYVLSGTFKSLGNETSKVYYGFRTYGANKQEILPEHSNIVLESETVLVEECKKGDKAVKIKANDKWKAGYFGVAFNIKEDFSDLPNYEVAHRIAKVLPEGDNTTLELSAPLAKGYPAGTKVRAHAINYGTYLYTAVCGIEIPKSWTSYSKSAELGKPGQTGWQYFRPGTAFVKLIILPNYDKNRNSKDVKLAFTDLTLKVAE